MVEYKVADRVAHISLDRAEKRNAFNAELVAALKNAFAKAAEDESVKLILLKAKGKVFSAGADLGYLQSLKGFSYEENLADSSSLAELYAQIYQHPKVVVAQIEGSAIAGGCGLATVCDFSFAVPEAQFGYTETKIGFVPAIVMIFLLRKIGEGKAKELLLTGKLITAAEAANFGLINAVVPADEIENHVNQFMQKLLLETSAASLQLTKQMIARVQELSLNAALADAAANNAAARMTKDCQAGMTAFLNKEKIIW